MTRRRFAAASILFLALATLGCGAADEAPPPDGRPDPFAGATIHARIGEKGGTLAGEEGTVLAGVSLTIPPGALAADTEITIHTTFDPTPMPVLAMHCGIQIAIEPDGLSLAKPASLTLPTTAGLVHSFAAKPEDVKVWERDGSKWSRLDATGNTDASVTVDVAELTTLGAGVKFPANPACAGVKCVPCTDPSGTGLCTQSIPINGPAPNFPGFAVSAGYLYYVNLAPTGVGAQVRFVGVRVRLSDGATVLSGSVVLPSDFYGGRTVTVDSDGSIWAGLGDNVHFMFGAPAEQFDNEGFCSQAMGAALLANGDLLRLCTNRRTLRHNGQYMNVQPWELNGKSYQFLGFAANTAPGDTGVFAFEFSSASFYLWDQVYDIPSVFNNSGYVFEANSADVGHDGAANAAPTVSGAGSGVVTLLHGGKISHWMPPNGEYPWLTSLRADGKVWVAPLAPEVMRYDPAANTAVATPLSNAPKGTDAYYGAYPVAIHDSSSGLVVLTQDQHFILVK